MLISAAGLDFRVSFKGLPVNAYIHGHVSATQIVFSLRDAVDFDLVVRIDDVFTHVLVIRTVVLQARNAHMSLIECACLRWQI